MEPYLHFYMSLYCAQKQINSPVTSLSMPVGEKWPSCFRFSTKIPYLFFNVHNADYVSPQIHVCYIKYRIFFQVEDIKYFSERVIYFERDKLIRIVRELEHRLWKMTLLFIGRAHSSFRSATSVSLLKWRLFILHLGREKEKCHEILLLPS